VSGRRAVRGLWSILPERVKRRAKEGVDAYRERARRAGWMRQLLGAAAEVTGGNCLSDRGLEGWQTERQLVKQRLAWMLGLNPLPPRTPLSARVTGRIERDRYTIEKIVFESIPGLFVTGSYYGPRGRVGPVPCVLYLCGHQIHPHGAKTQYQDRYQWYPAHGFACLVIDSLQCGEIQGVHHGTHTLGMWDWLSLGYTPAGVEVWNAMRAIDWLESRPEVDAARVGVTGVSGGGVMSWYLTALDDRVKAAAPSSSAYTVGSQAAAGLVPSQCDCTFYPNVHRIDFPTIGALIAPRPLLMLAGRADRIFPPAGYREVHRQLRKIYGLYEAEGSAPGGLRLAECNNGHADSPESLREARAWMCRWLWPENESARQAVADDAFSREPSASLVCLADPPADAGNHSIHRRFIHPSQAAKPVTLRAWELRRDEVIAFLRDTILDWFPKSNPGYSAQKSMESGGHARRFAKFSAWEIESEPGARVSLQLFEPHVALASAPLLVVVKRSEDQVVFPDDEVLPLLTDHQVMILSPRFTQWCPGPARFAEVERTAALAGRSIAAMQVWDVIRAVRWALDDRKLDAPAVSVFGRGAAGIVGLYAALFEERIAQVVLDTPPGTHREGPAIPAILRGTDIPEVAAAMAPRKLTFLSEPPAAFDLTRHVFRLAGCEGHYWRADSLGHAVRGRHGSQAGLS